MIAGGAEHGKLLAECSRRDFVRRASLLGLGLLVAEALEVARLMGAPEPALAQAGGNDATLQAFADTMIPGRRAATTDLGAAIDPSAIAGVDELPGAVEADALALFHHPEIGFDALEPVFLTELESRSLPLGANFLSLDFGHRVQVALAGLDFSNSTRVVWEAAAAVPFTAFCAAAINPNQTAAKASGYRVMGLPGEAPNGYQRDFSYGRRLSRERTTSGSLP
ncbi:MAG TPA: DUF5987 family protein [Solirubrobacteraceae bacterium]|nr:DUF5987 family protein [Solirubrobacteraceae bacterium]